ncbi:peptide-methionine (R)-S-oxide reductase MsrB [bacterium]|nr:peptide-methionine (R)-S-oxide reductase MsrB [bacterium]
MWNRICLAVALLLAGCAAQPGSAQTPGPHSFPVTHSDEEWKKQLNPEQYQILRHKETERAFTGQYYNNHDPGLYFCAGCGQLLFKSEDKFESGTGWPSFVRPAEEKSVLKETDTSWGMQRVEVECANCGGHLGHVFEDGPQPTGLRYCINSASLNFKKQ